MFPQRCAYGVVSHESGFTTRAMKSREWVDKRREKYEPWLNKLTSASSVIADVGDYVYLPYSHMNMNKQVPFLAHSALFLSGSPFVLKSDFTIDTIIKMCEFRPQAMMGGEIRTYQTEVVPEFLKHLYEHRRELFNELCKRYDRAKKIATEYTFVGRKATLATLVPNVGEYTDIHSGKWVWDGKYLTSFNSHACFMLVRGYTELRVKPPEDAVVAITDDGQVDENTSFVA